MEIVDLCDSADSSFELSSSAISNRSNDENLDVDFVESQNTDYGSLNDKNTQDSASASQATSGVFSLTSADSNETDIDILIEKYTKVRSPKKKGEAQKLRQLKTANKNRDKALQKIENDKKKSIKPGECMKYITIEIGPSILSKSYADDLIETIASSGVKCKPEAPLIAPDNCIGWTRTRLEQSVDLNGEIRIKSEETRERFILVFYDMSEFADLLIDRSLNTYMHNLKESTDCQVSLLLFGCKAYFKSKSNPIKLNDLDYYLSKLLFEEAVSSVKVDNPSELNEQIMHFTKSVAEIYFKNERQAVDDQVKFYMRGDNKDCVRVDKDGNGLLQLWRRSFTKFPLVSLEKSHAICQHFESPQDLVKTISVLSAEEAQRMLADIPIRRAADPCAKLRRIGPELARKIYTFFASIDGNQLLS